MSSSILSKKILARFAFLICFVAVITLGVKSQTYAQTPSLGNLDQTSASTSPAEVDIFLSIDGIEGESTDEAHENEIVLESFSWGASQSDKTLSGAATGKVKFQDLNFTKRVDKSSPVLMLSTASGKHYKEATLTVRKKGETPQDFLIIKMSDVVISSYNVATQGEIPGDSVNINFAKVEYKYIPQYAGGSEFPVTTGWDIKLNKGV